jgi:phosphoribosylpyrophosphate synthetase
MEKVSDIRVETYMDNEDNVEVRVSVTDSDVSITRASGKLMMTWMFSVGDAVMELKKKLDSKNEE